MIACTGGLGWPVAFMVVGVVIALIAFISVAIKHMP